MINDHTLPNIHLTITAPDQTLFEGSVSQATFPGAKGRFQVLKNHAPLITTLQKGTITYHDGTQSHQVATDAAIMEVIDNQITVLVTR